MKRKILFLLLFSITLLSCASDPLKEDIEDIIIDVENSNSNSNSNKDNDNNNSDNKKEELEFSSIDILNAYKRAHQFLDIKWEAISPIPQRNSHTGYSIGIHEGMLYSSVKEYNKYIGYDVSIKTFMTALHNKYSLLYTEDVLKSRSTSAYGIKYQGTNCGAYMGTVCSSFVAYTLGLEIPYVTGEYAHLVDMDIFEKIEDQSVNGIKIMDVIWEPGHANIITNIVRNSSNEIVKVVWSESDSPYVKSTDMSKEHFTNRLTNKGGIIYRYKKWGEHAEYKPSEFVSVMGESVSYQYNEDICTFAGDYACFREGDLIVINYEKKDFSAMEIMKNDEIIATIDLPEDASNHSINLQDMNLSYGQYKARLAGGNGYSDYTYFEIIQTDVSFENYGDNQRITFNSANATPLYIMFSNRAGNNILKYILNTEDKQNCFAVIDAKKLLYEFNGQSSFESNVYLKVFFQGKYGRVTNHFLKINL